MRFWWHSWLSLKLPCLCIFSPNDERALSASESLMQTRRGETDNQNAFVIWTHNNGGQYNPHLKYTQFIPCCKSSFNSIFQIQYFVNNLRWIISKSYSKLQTKRFFIELRKSLLIYVPCMNVFPCTTPSGLQSASFRNHFEWNYLNTVAVAVAGGVAHPIRYFPLNWFERYWWCGVSMAESCKCSRIHIAILNRYTLNW